LHVHVSGQVGTVTYQWIKDGVDKLNETLDTYEVDSVTEDDEGWYSCRVEDESKGVRTTEPVLIRVFPEGSMPVAGVLGLGILLTACGLGAVKLLRRK